MQYLKKNYNNQIITYSNILNLFNLKYLEEFY